MDFFDKLGKKASEAYKVTADKTGKIAKETKIKLKIGELKSQISDIYEEIGKKVYEKHVRKEDMCIKKDLEELCTKIDVLSDEIDGLLQQSLELKDKKQCPKCFKEIEKNAQFCPHCGAKQTEEPKSEDVEVKPENNQENSQQTEKEELQSAEKVEEENEAKELEEVVDDEEIEAEETSEIEEKDEEVEDEEVDEEEIDEEEIDEEAKDDLEKTVEIESNVNLEEDDEQ